MVEECEMSMKILGLGSPGLSLGLGRAIKKEQPETHGNQVKSHVAAGPPPREYSRQRGWLRLLFMYQRLNSPPLIKPLPSYPPHHIYSGLD
jgi:hypothetical protein